MQEIDTTRERTPIDSADSQEKAASRLGVFHWRYLVVYLILIGLVLLAVLPPLVNVSRFKRRIVTSISASIGRPVHLDNVSLVLLPFPGFKLENFVVEEAPAFGAEPVIHANNVVATLRFSSLWRRKVEFSKISLREPSINLVHMPNGRWNVESILLQAAKIPAAPTAQVRAGADPRFPYIEATGARVNIKYGDEKMPFSLTEADFALWLPRPMEWRVRIEGKPTRTDTSASDTGTVSLEGTLGRAERFELLPIDIEGEWKNAPLGEASRVLLGRDAGLRGELRVNVSLNGTVNASIVKTSLQLRGARRAEFVPAHSLDLRIECQAEAAETFHAFHQVRCSWPPPTTPSLLALTAEVPDIHKAGAAPFELGTPGLPTATLIEWLRVASPRISPDLSASGMLTGSLGREVAGGVYSGHFGLSKASVKGGAIGDAPIAIGNVTVVSAPVVVAPVRTSRRVSGSTDTATAAGGEFVMAPTTLDLGGKEPALLEGHFDQHQYSLHLYGNVLPSRLMTLAEAVPQFGDGLRGIVSPTVAAPAKETPLHVDLVSSRVWGEGQTWAKAPVKAIRNAGDRHR